MNTQSASAKPDHLADLARKRGAFALRARLDSALRAFFLSHSFLEVSTPIRISSPAPETHIDPIPCDGSFLRTSPELQMKQMLCAGYERIFQIGPCFRKNELGRIHREEFSMLEWYECGSDYIGILEFTKKMLENLSFSLTGSPKINYRGQNINLSQDAWETMTVEDAFAEFAEISLEDALKNDRFDEVLSFQIEPAIPKDHPFVLIDYPAEMAAFAKLKDDRSEVAERWELYLGGIEIANTYTELLDSHEYGRRFANSADERAGLGKSTPKFDDAFLHAMSKGMPPCAGSALGLDRLLMILADASSLDEILSPFR